MKKWLAIILLSLSSSGGKAQIYQYVAFPDSNADWYTYTSFPVHGTGSASVSAHYSLHGDSLFDDITTGDYILRTDTSKRTYLRSYLYYGDNREHIIYDFSLLPGQSIVDTLSNSSTRVTRVDSIQYVLINNMYRKKFYLTETRGIYVLTRYWIEGIGSLNAGPTTWEPHSTGPGVFENLCSFQHNGLIVSSDGVVIPNCTPTSTTGLAAIDQDAQINTYPNPSANNFQIKASEPIRDIAITDLLGRLIYTNTYDTDQVEVNTGEWTNGIYIVKVNGKGSIKFVKE